MRLSSLILLLGVCSPHWTIATLYSFRNYIIDLDENTSRLLTVMPYLYHVSTMNLSGLQAPYYEKNVFDNVTDIRALDLSKNGIEELPQEIFSKLTNLEQLSLAYNILPNVTGLFRRLKNLKHLDLSHNQIEKFQRGDLYGLPKFTNIVIEGNGFESLYSGAFEDPSVPTFETESRSFMYYEYSEENGIADTPLPNDFAVKICRSKDGIVESVEQFRRNENLGECIRALVDRQRRSLRLADLGLQKFARGWYKLPHHAIKKIDLSFNMIRDITPELLNDLPMGLTIVDLSYNRLEMIRRDVIENKFIKKLIFDYNYIETIEDGAFEKTNLLDFRAGTNTLTSLAFLRTFPKSIEVLGLSYNGITQIPAHTFRGLRNLRMIDVSFNFLETIGPGIFLHQMNLLEIRMANNNITELNPGLFKGLKMPKLFDFSHNQIKRISRSTFSELWNLEGIEIHLHDNKINYIEAGSFSNLKLTFLDLSVNILTDYSIAKGAFDYCEVQRLLLGSNFFSRINSELFKSINGSYQLSLDGNLIITIGNRDARYLDNVEKLVLDRNPMQFLTNGALYGISKDKNVEISLYGAPIKVIQAGVFDNV